MEEKREKNSQLENGGDALPAGANPCSPKDGDPQVTGKEPKEGSEDAVGPSGIGGDGASANVEAQPSDDPTSSEAEDEPTGDSETPESGTAEFGDAGDGASNPHPPEDLVSGGPTNSMSKEPPGGSEIPEVGGDWDSGDPTGSGQPQGSERVDLVPPLFQKGGYTVKIGGGGAHFIRDVNWCVEMENQQEFQIELSNNNVYSCDVDIQMTKPGSGTVEDVGGWRLDAGQKNFPIQNSGYGQGKFVFHSSDPGKMEGETNQKNKENFKSILEIKFTPEAYSIYFKMRNNKSVTNIRLLKTSEQLKFTDVLKKWVEKKNMDRDGDYSKWCFSDGHVTINLPILIKNIANKQDIRKPLWLFKDKEKISLKLNGGDRKEIEVCPLELKFSEFMDKVSGLFGGGDYECKLGNEAISEDNVLKCLIEDGFVEVIEKPKPRAVDPTTEGSRGGFRGIGLTRGIEFGNEGERGGFRGLGYRGPDDFEDEDMALGSWREGDFREVIPGAREGFIRYEGEPVQAFHPVSSDANAPFYTAPEHKVVMTIRLVSFCEQLGENGD